MNRKISVNILLLILAFLFALKSDVLAGTIYVDASATGANNGSSWVNAFIYLQDALTAAASGDQIWVAQGIYKPDRGVSFTIGDRMAEFGLKAGVALYGGFPVGGGTWQQRDPNIYASVLSGDLNGDDTPNFGNREDNTKWITSIRWRTGTTTLDGFIIRGAYNMQATDVYNGMALYNGTPGGGNIVISNCKFLDNKGVAIYLKHPDDVSPSNGYYVGTLTGSTITNCVFQNNYNSGRYVIYMRGVSPVFKNCVFEKNTASAISIYSYQAWPENLSRNAKTFTLPLS